MSDRLPLFPLGMVLFPGLLLPLHVFEERYRVLVRDLLELPEQERRFGVVAIRLGREVGADGVTALHDVGCTAMLRRVETYADGRYDIVTTGADRFAFKGLTDTAPYLVAEVDWLPEVAGDEDETALLDRAVRAAFRDYLGLLGKAQGDRIEGPELPPEPLVLSYLVAATVVVDLEDRQSLLAIDDLAGRLRAELVMLRREATMLRTLTSTPAPELSRAQVNLN